MTHPVLDPADLHDPTPFGYRHTTRVPAGKELVFVAGQYASSPDGRVVSAEFAAQVRQALDNLGRALAAHELTFADVVQLRTYVVGLDFAKLGVIGDAVTGRWGSRPPTNTLLGVAALAMPDMLFEIEAVAARP
ncbi:MAG: RidA family protein [Myxococcota bacterium]|jgi:enamine deaminase RidA (YjgF/YER057c/UK114 family)|nr:RidA family protein [Myxococcota bacterium]